MFSRLIRISFLLFAVLSALFACNKNGGSAIQEDFSLVYLDEPVGCDSILNTIEQNDPLLYVYQQLCAANSIMDQYYIVELIDTLKAHGKSDISAQIISILLAENHPIYNNRGKREANRLRSYLIASLGETGTPQHCIPILLSELKHFDPKNKILIASCVRAINGLDSNAHILIPYLLPFLDETFPDEEMDLESYNSFYPFKQSTYLKKEILLVLNKINSNLEDALPILNHITKSEYNSIYNRNKGLMDLVRKTIAHIQTRKTQQEKPTAQKNDKEIIFLTKWIDKDLRAPNRFTSTKFINQEGSEFYFKDLYGTPFLITFFYTSCSNYNKCSMTVSKFRELERAIEETKLKGKVHLCAVTLDPSFDNFSRINNYFENRQYYYDNYSHILSGNNDKLICFFKDLNLGVSHFNSDVILHDIELLLFDKKGRFVRKYKKTHWNNNLLFEDLSKLSKEKF
ncbi:MAG: SCO family protein [Bacteroidota bacterium]